MSSVPPLRPPAGPSVSTGDFVHAFGGRFYRIGDVHRLPVFFMNVPSASDLWLFLASNGALTAGRTDAELALFPYATVDRIYDSAGLTGPQTLIRVATPAGPLLWEPFAPHETGTDDIRRHLYKSVEGDQVWFEEVNSALGLVFRYGWATAGEHGFVRRCELENLTDASRSVHLLDALRNLLPPGIGTRLQNGSSCLADAYKMAEVVPGTTLAVYSLSAGIVDRAVPLESLRAAAVWSAGLPGAKILLSDAPVAAFAAGSETPAESHTRGRRTNYLLTAATTLAPRGTARWLMVADTGLSQADVAARRRDLADGGLPAAVLAAVATTTRRLRQIVATADGLQQGGDETATAHHFANVLFNVMRGGVFVAGSRVPGDDFAKFVRTHHRAAAARHAAFLAGLPATLTRAELLRRVSAIPDLDLARLAREYLPLTFSRRHGDPSRPWNRFRIHVSDEQGRQVLAHEGNWRDIFQNWESLCLSHPEFYDAVVAKFLNASTADGYNPYRLTHTGLDWEVPDHEDPWSTIGYWGDHQVVYLLKLLEWSGRFYPDRLAAGLHAPLYSYAEVPYRIAPYAELRRNPRATITFDEAAHRSAVARAATFGSDARLLGAAAGAVRHVNLTEKLLLLTLTRLANFVPGGGIWMNTQRPEWNDANNALVGSGVSQVTLCYFRRLLAHWQQSLLPAAGPEPVPVSAAVVALGRRIQAALAGHRALLAAPDYSAPDRGALLGALAAAGSDYRTRLYRDGPGEPVLLPPAEIAALLAAALAFVDHTIRSNRREDGLYHSYNLLEFTEPTDGVRLHRLAPMLEGQVAVLSSGLLSPAEVLALLDALRASPLYRADQHSYLLYPDRELPGFIARNVIPPDRVAANPLLIALLEAGDRRVVERDADGIIRFAPELANAEALDAALRHVAADPDWRYAVSVQTAAVHGIYEEVFHHRAFTGRSGTMFGYEGLGCIYWHMVAKLLLAVQENLLAAQAAGAPETGDLLARYFDIRAGLGFNKSPAVYGAFPTDPYSHTPGHSGAQQPGMTGQVKEEILTRFGELGIGIAGGLVSFRPTLLRAGEFTRTPDRFTTPLPDGRLADLPLPARALAFTFCGVPVLYLQGDVAAQLEVSAADGKTQRFPGTELDPATSARLFARDGSITGITVHLGSAYRPLPA